MIDELADMVCSGKNLQQEVSRIHIVRRNHYGVYIRWQTVSSCLISLDTQMALICKHWFRIGCRRHENIIELVRQYFSSISQSLEFGFSRHIVGIAEPVFCLSFINNSCLVCDGFKSTTPGNHGHDALQKLTVLINLGGN